MARPSEYSPAMAERICVELGLGRSLRKICEAEDTPDRSTVLRWLHSQPEFRAQYALAREVQAESHADEIVDIADTEADPQKARVRIDARKWAAAKQKPKAFGDKLQHVGGSPDDPPIQFNLTTLSDEELAALADLREKLALGGGDQG